MLEREDHVELAARGVGDPPGQVDRRARHLTDGQQVPRGQADLTVHLGEELLEAGAVRHRCVRRPEGGAGRHRAVGQGGVAREEVDDVHPEAVDTTVDPPAHHGVDGPPHVGVLPVEVGLLAREQVQVVLAARLVELPGRPGEDRLPVRRLRAGGPGLVPGPRRSPPVPVALGRARVTGLDEPRVLVGGVVDDQVHHQPDAVRVAPRDERVEVGQRAEERVDVLVVADVVAVVVHRGAVDRRQPEHVDAEPGEVVEVRGDAGEVADAVAVAVGERARVHLVDHGGSPPARGPGVGAERRLGAAHRGRHGSSRGGRVGIHPVASAAGIPSWVLRWLPAATTSAPSSGMGAGSRGGQGSP